MSSPIQAPIATVFRPADLPPRLTIPLHAAPGNINGRRWTETFAIVRALLTSPHIARKPA
jgi:hypothetical protein